MSNISDREKYERLNNCIYWKRTTVDRKGRILLPIELRQKLNVQNGSEILWIQCIHKKDHENEFVIEIGIENNASKKRGEK